MHPRLVAMLSGVSLAAVTACHSQRDGALDVPKQGSAMPSPPAHDVKHPTVAAQPVTAASHAVVIVAEPAALRALESKGFDLGSLLTAVPGQKGSELAPRPMYRVVTNAMAKDLAEARAKDPAAGVGMQYSHRQFDVKWLASPQTSFRLSAVVNRLDRMPFAEDCGEVRFVYRLSYESSRAGGFSSNLPMTVNVVYYQPRDAAGSCREAARAWMRGDDVKGAAAEAAWLDSAAGPLSTERRKAWKSKSVEVNFQSVRWPATVRPQLGGHAEYVLRVFHRTEVSPGLAPQPLENTPDVERLSRDPGLRAELEKFLTDPAEMPRVMDGTVVLPEKFLATRAISVAPHGLARLANRPFANVLSKGFAGAGASAGFSPASFTRRLDTLSCPGCHQVRSIAGFHLLGVDPKEDRLDAIEVPMSPHLHGDLDRRRAYVEAVAAGKTPDDRRPFAERTDHDDGRTAHCGLGDPGFDAWTCAAGLHCVRGLDPEVGTCEPDEPAVGASCENATLASSRDSHRDGASVKRLGCGEERPCETSAVGFPGGMCAGGCGGLARDATCGAIAILDPFNACLGRGTPFERCVAENTRPGALQSCGFHTPCRDDYVCARTETASGCIPPYFLFQLRVDGHTL